MYFIDLFNKYSLEELSKANEDLKVFQKNEALEYLYNNLKNFFATHTIENNFKNETIVAIRLEEDVYWEEDEYKKPNFVYKPQYYLHAYTILENDDETYSLLFVPWEEYKYMNVSEDSIELFGEIDTLMAILYEMGFMGLDENSQTENILQETEKIKQAKKEVEEGKTYSWNEMKEFFSKEYGYEEPSKKEKELNDFLFLVCNSGNALISFSMDKKNTTEYYKGYNYFLTPEEKNIIKELIKKGYSGIPLFYKSSEKIPKKNLFMNYKGYNAEYYELLKHLVEKL